MLARRDLLGPPPISGWFGGGLFGLVACEDLWIQTLVGFGFLPAGPSFTFMVDFDSIGKIS